MKPQAAINLNYVHQENGLTHVEKTDNHVNVFVLLIQEIVMVFQDVISIIMLFAHMG